MHCTAACCGSVMVNLESFNLKQSSFIKIILSKKSYNGPWAKAKLFLNVFVSSAPWPARSPLSSYVCAMSEAIIHLREIGLDLKWYKSHVFRIRVTQKLTLLTDFSSNFLSVSKFVFLERKQASSQKEWYKRVSRVTTTGRSLSRWVVLLTCCFSK